MIFLKRKRLIFWLLRAYIKRWGKIIFTCIAVVIVVILLLFFNRKFIKSIAPVMNVEKIGVVGDYPQDDFPNNLPPEILDKVSEGLTKILPNDKVVPDVAKKW